MQNGGVVKERTDILFFSLQSAIDIVLRLQMLFHLIVIASALSEGHALFGENGRVFDHAVDKLLNSQVQKRFEKETITELKKL